MVRVLGRMVSVLGAMLLVLNTILYLLVVLFLFWLNVGSSGAGDTTGEALSLLLLNLAILPVATALLLGGYLLDPPRLAREGVTGVKPDLDAPFSLWETGWGSAARMIAAAALLLSVAMIAYEGYAMTEGLMLGFQSFFDLLGNSAVMVASPLVCLMVILGTSRVTRESYLLGITDAPKKTWLTSPRAPAILNLMAAALIVSAALFAWHGAWDPEGSISTSVSSAVQTLILYFTPLLFLSLLLLFTSRRLRKRGESKSSKTRPSPPPSAVRDPELYESLQQDLKAS